MRAQSRGRAKAGRSGGFFAGAWGSPFFRGMQFFYGPNDGIAYSNQRPRCDLGRGALPKPRTTDDDDASDVDARRGWLIGLVSRAGRVTARRPSCAGPGTPPRACG